MKIRLCLALALSSMVGGAWADATSSSGTGTAASQQVSFWDSKLFDGKLSGELDKGGDLVEVDTISRISLGNIPARLDRWMTEVGQSGKVVLQQAEPAAQTRDLFGVVPMVFGLVDKLHEAHLYAPAKLYDVTIIYHKNSEGDSLIDKIVFKKKQ